MHPKYWAQTTPEKSAIVMASSGERVAYGELDLRSNRLAQLLRARGLRTGDVIAVLMENHPLPRHETGKIYKRLLKQRYAETPAGGKHTLTGIPMNS